MSQHHEYLMVNLCDVGISGLCHSGGVKLCLFSLDTEVEEVLGRKCVPHPDVFAVFQCFVLVACGRYPMESEVAKER
jgi:hypothetical protein